MKKLYNILLATLLIVSTIFISCDDDYMETNLGDKPLTLSVNNETIVLDITAPQSEAVTLEWTPGSNFNTNAAITYTFQLGVAGTNFQKSIQMELGEGKNSVSYTTDELNSILINQFGLAPNSDVELEAQVKAKVHYENIADQISETVKLKVTSYKPVSSTLYIIGSAAPNGWNADEATRMNTVSGASGGFVWQGKLNAGEIKFITTLGSFIPSFNKGTNDSELYLRESDDDADDKFTIPSTGIYKISVNIINLTIHIETLDAPEFGALWFVGNATNWSFKAMVSDASDPFIFHYNDNLSAGGEFKIGTVQDSWDAIFLRPVVDQTSQGTNMDMDKWAGDPDNKWNIDGGVYKIIVNTRDMKIDIVPFAPFAMIYMVGDATPSGWNIDNPTPMVSTTDPFKFTWTGTLNAGEMKFTCDKQNDWNGSWFLAAQNGVEPTGSVEQMIFSPSGSNPDNKWKISSSGTYTIELDQLQETVTIKKQ